MGTPPPMSTEFRDPARANLTSEDEISIDGNSGVGRVGRRLFLSSVIYGDWICWLPLLGQLKNYARRFITTDGCNWRWKSHFSLSSQRIWIKTKKGMNLKITSFCNVQLNNNLGKIIPTSWTASAFHQTITFKISVLTQEILSNIALCGPLKTSLQPSLYSYILLNVKSNARFCWMAQLFGQRPGLMSIYCLSLINECKWPLMI